MQHERKEALRVKQEVKYKKNIQEHRDKNQQIKKLLNLLASKELYKWDVSNLKKMINWKKVKADGATPSRKKTLLVLWDLVRRRTKPNLPKRSDEEMDMNGVFDSEIYDGLCKGDEKHQVTSVII